MAIRTRYGTDVTLIGNCSDGDGVHIRYADEDREAAVPIHELRADHGLIEITQLTLSLPTVECDHRAATG